MILIRSTTQTLGVLFAFSKEAAHVIIMLPSILITSTRARPLHHTRFKLGRPTHIESDRLRITCPARKDTADWLVELTGEAGASYRSADVETGEPSPVTPKEFSAKWRASAAGKAIDQARKAMGDACCFTLEVARLPK